MSKHADAFRNLLGADTVEVQRGPPVTGVQPASPVTTVPPTPAASTPPATPPQAPTPPATPAVPDIRLPPGVTLPQTARPSGGKEDSLRDLAKRKDELEAQLTQERADAAAKIKAAEDAATKLLADAEARLATYDYASTREFREKFAEPEARVKSTAVAFARAVKPDVVEAEFNSALDLPAKDFDAFLDAQGIVAKGKLVDLWAERQVIRAQAKTAIEAAPARIKQVREEEQAQAQRAATFELKRRQDNAFAFAVSLRDTVPGFEDQPNNPAYAAVVNQRRALVAGALSEGDLSPSSRDLVIKGALFDEVAEENRNLREQLKSLQAAAGNHRVARPLGLPSAPPPRAPAGGSHRDAHSKFLK